jgi:hypothetical protein
MLWGTIILIAVTGVTLLVAYAIWRAIKSADKAQEAFRREPFHCGTPYVHNGGTLIARTGNMIEIITRDGTETMTVDEYETRKAAQEKAI